GVSADADDGIDAVARAVEAVELFELTDDSLVGVHRKDCVVVAVHEQEWPRRHEPGDSRPGPLECIVEKHAVTVPIDDPVRNVGWEVSHAAHRDGDFDALVSRGDPECRGPAATDSGDG